VSSRSNNTTRPPRSPVARYRPVSSNSTVEMMSAAGTAGAAQSRRRRYGLPTAARAGPRAAAVPSLTSVVLPLSPKHCENFQPPLSSAMVATRPGRRFGGVPNRDYRGFGGRRRQWWFAVRARRVWPFRMRAASPACPALRPGFATSPGGGPMRPVTVGPPDAHPSAGPRPSIGPRGRHAPGRGQRRRAAFPAGCDGVRLRCGRGRAAMAGRGGSGAGTLRRRGWAGQCVRLGRDPLPSAPRLPSLRYIYYTHLICPRGTA